MADFFVAVIGIVQALFIGWLIASYSKYRLARESEINQNAEELVAKAIEESEKQKTMVVARSVDDVVCRYNDLIVYRYIKTSDDRTFVFESVAVESSPEVYHADHPDGTYIIVDQCLLYREVPVE